jgi:hypothetical protein
VGTVQVIERRWERVRVGTGRGYRLLPVWSSLRHTVLLCPGYRCRAYCGGAANLQGSRAGSLLSSERSSPRRSPNVPLRNRQSSSEKLEEGVSVDKEAICIIG